MGIAGIIMGTFIGNCFGTGIDCSGVEVGLGVRMTGGAHGISYCRSLSMVSTMIFQCPHKLRKGVGF